MISDGKKLPSWTPRSTRTINMGFSPKHAITVPIVLNPQTGYITPQFHVVFNDWFATVPASVDDLPDFNADSWKRIFRDSTYRYILDDEDQERLIVETEIFEKEQDILSQQQRIATAIDAATPPSALPVEPPPTRTPVDAMQQQPPVNETTQPPVPSTPPLLTPRESPTPSTPAVASPPHLIQDPQPQPPTPMQLFQSPLRPLPPDVPTHASIETNDEIVTVKKQASDKQQRHSPRRSTRTRKAPDRLGYDGRQGRGYLLTLDDIIFDWLHTEAIEDSSTMSQANKASVSDPDTLSFEEAMSDVENIQNWMRAAEAEIKSLEKNGTWKEVPTANAKSRILPGTWFGNMLHHSLFI